MNQLFSLLRSCVSLWTVVVVVGCVGFVSAQVTARIVQDAPLFLYPDRAREPIVIMERGVTVEVNERRGDWFNVTVHGSQWGDRTGYVEAKYLQLRSIAGSDATTNRPVPRVSAPRADTLASLQPLDLSVPVEEAATNRPIPRSTAPRPNTPASLQPLDLSVPVEETSTGVQPPAYVPAAVAAVAPSVANQQVAPRAPRPVANLSLKNVRRIYIEPMPGDLDQYISAEITKEFKGSVVVVLDKANADAIMRGVGENKSGVGAAITGRYLGLHDNATASITLIDPDETTVLWASEAGDRSLMWGSLARGGQRKVADRLVNNLKKALREAK